MLCTFGTLYIKNKKFSSRFSIWSIYIIVSTYIGDNFVKNLRRGGLKPGSLLRHSTLIEFICGNSTRHLKVSACLLSSDFYTYFLSTEPEFDAWHILHSLFTEFPRGRSTYRVNFFHPRNALLSSVVAFDIRYLFGLGVGRRRGGGEKAKKIKNFLDFGE